jgi:hypothetical protein
MAGVSPPSGPDLEQPGQASETADKNIHNPRRPCMRVMQLS